MEKEKSYQETMLEIESIVKLLENNNPDIDNMIKNIKHATEMIKFCKDKLKAAETELNEIL